MNHEVSKVREILKNTSKRILENPNVVSTGVGYKIEGGKRTSTLSIMCSVIEKLPSSKLSSKEIIASSFDGIPTDIIQTGVIRALANTGRIRPAPGGVSIGHIAITAGTLGCLVKKNNEVFILSNNHVLANSNNAQIGDPILQPGPYDGGTNPADHIANLYQFIPINFIDIPSNCFTAAGIAGFLNGLAKLVNSNARFRTISIEALENLVDAAIAKPVNDNDVISDILDIGTIQGTVSGELGMAIKKSGRTTGLTTGEITQVDVTATVSYGDMKTALFRDQLMAGAMSQGGDSGSAVLTGNNLLTGLLFAGSDSTTIINRIENVFTALGVSV
ncbi:MAG: hypothetical protein Q8N38_01155 [Bacteroidales bacterium]|nr:hypothetical protein [Bacteroidales bacterium]